MRCSTRRHAAFPPRCGTGAVCTPGLNGQWRHPRASCGLPRVNLQACMHSWQRCSRTAAQPPMAAHTVAIFELLECARMVWERGVCMPAKLGTCAEESRLSELPGTFLPAAGPLPAPPFSAAAPPASWGCASLPLMLARALRENCCKTRKGTSSCMRHRPDDHLLSFKSQQRTCSLASYACKTCMYRCWRWHAGAKAARNLGPAGAGQRGKCPHPQSVAVPSHA